MNPNQPLAEAVAVKADHILKVGSNAEIQPLIGKNTKVTRLNGKTLLPGFIDTHIHVADFARFLMWLDLSPVGCIKDMQRIICARLKKTAKGKWVVGRGWDEKHFAEKRLPTRFDLDAAAPSNPVIFYHACGQIAVANSRALQLAHVTAKTPEPTGGIIEKDAATGELTGVLRETATDLVWKVIPEASNEEVAESAEVAFSKILEAGITSIHWLATSDADLPVVRSLCRAKKLPLRVYMVLQVNHLEQIVDKSLQTEFKNTQARLGGVEIYADGFLSSKQLYQSLTAMTAQWRRSRALNKKSTHTPPGFALRDCR